MPSRRRGIVLFALKLGVSASLLALLFSRLGAEDALGLLAGAHVPLLLAGAACLLGQTALSTFKWYLLLRAQGMRVAYLPLLKMYFASNFINLFLPGVLGGDAYRAAKLRHHTQGVRAALPSILVDRGTGIATLLAAGTLGMALVFFREHFVPIVIGLVLSMALGYLLIIGPFARMAGRVRSGAYFGLFGVLAQVARALQPSPTFFCAVAISLVFHFNTVLINWIYSLAAGIDVTFPQLLVIVPAVYLVEMIPISINGIGVREGTFTVLFAQLGLVPEHGLVLGLTVTVMRYVAGIVGGVLLATDLLGRRGGAAPVQGSG